MEQAPGLTMNPPSVPPSPGPPSAPDPANDIKSSTPNPSDTIPSGSGTSSSSEIATPTPKTAAERGFGHGLDRENLETEVTQVMGTLNNWWGGVKKQSTSTFWSMKADMDKAVLQAQADLEKLKTTNVEIVRKDIKSDVVDLTDEKEIDIKGKGKERAGGGTTLPTDSGSASTSTSTSTGTGTGAGVDAVFPGATAAATDFFHRITSSTNQIQHTLQSTTAQLQNSLQSTLAAAQANPALSNPSQIRDQLVENLRSVSNKENIQLSLKQAEKLAEEYLKKGDQWVKGAEKWVEDNVKIVPPEEAERRAAGMSWDGSDFYSFSTSTPGQKTSKSDGESIGSALGAGSKTPTRQGPLAGSRKEALLTRLREDKELLTVDPAGEEETAERRKEFEAWVNNDWERTVKAEREKEEGNVGEIRMALVPELLSDEQFWQRYLFHKSMIEAEDNRRKAVLAASQQAVQEDFSWDDEPESTTSSVISTSATSPPAPTVKAPSAATTPKAQSDDKMPNSALPTASPAATASTTTASASASTSVPASKANTATSTSTSPRDSEESYDVVRKQSAAPTDDDDSDWE